MMKFDEVLKTSRDQGSLAPHDALIMVADTCDMGLRWFREAGMDPTPADLLEWTRLVLSQHHGAQE
jgi:hypothetical protein